jgi:hypothetical protein
MGGGKKFTFKEVFSDIAPTSFTQTIYTGESGGELKQSVTIRATRLTKAKPQAASFDSKLSFDRNGAPLDSRKTTRPHSPVTFAVRIIAIRSVPPFSDCEPRSHPFAAFGCMGNHVCPDCVSIAYHGSDWNLCRRLFPLDCEREFEQSR